jgi:uridylate kinase
VTTDTAAALGAAELEVDALCKVTQVDGVYSADPHQVPDAEFFTALSYEEVIARRLKVMDLTAFELCQTVNIPIVIFNMHQPGNMKKLIDGESVGTVVSGE